jgi:catechol 2,3-dioxygenase-like lactoylglutathione lyase family enzyme
MQILRIDHVQLAMPLGEEDRARKFYSEMLGIPEVPKPTHLAKRGGAWFESGSLKVHLGVQGDFQPTMKAHVAFETVGLNDLIGCCQLAGYRVVDDEPLEGYVRVYIYDPFGNRLEFMERL